VNTVPASKWLGSLLVAWLLLPPAALADAEPAQASAPAAATVTAPAPVAATAPAPITPCQRPAAGATSYLPAAPVDSPALIAPPPPAGSDAERADLQAVLAAQRAARAAHTTARAIADSEISCARVAAAAGEYRDAGLARGALDFLTEAAHQTTALSSAAKRYWQRPRPYLLSDQVERLADVAPGAVLPEVPAGAASEEYRHYRDNTGYPSGHATFGMACGVLLARMVPERRRELFERGIAYGDSRVIVGAHYPSDVAAGRSLAVAAVALMLANPCFAEDFAGARTALRQSLRLPATP